MSMAISFEVATDGAKHLIVSVPSSSPFVRESGSGIGVICLHSNASNSGQWRGLIDMLSPKFHVLAPDSYDSGKSPAWPSNRIISLADEVALIDSTLDRAGPGCALVGHSYGAALALIAALKRPDRIAALALYEPTLFSLIEAGQPAPNDADGIHQAVRQAGEALDAGDTDTAARHFIDYWIEDGAWQAMPDARKPPIAASIVNVRRWAHALTTEPTPLDAFCMLDVPVLYMIGKRSPRSAQGIARLLTRVLPQVELVEFEELGHMAPLTHLEQVNPVIALFLERVLSGASAHARWAHR
jgi:pimeloyl-ACP methyl ester carboxylesterase